MPTYTDLFMRDTFDDQGVTPAGDADVCASPDIIPYGAQQLNTGTASYGPPPIGLPIDINNVNNVYVRAKNNNPTAAGSGTISLYWTPATLLANVASWKDNLLPNFNGTDPPFATLTNVPPQGVAFGDEAFAWNPQAAPGAPPHICLLARVSTATNPNPLPASFSSWQDFVNWVRNNANVAWHNVQTVNRLPAQGYQSSVTFVNVSLLDEVFHAFSAGYTGLPAGSVLRMWTPPGTDFLGFDVTITTTTAQPNGILPGTAAFPPGYGATIFCTCVFPGGPTSPPSGAFIMLKSWGPSQSMAEVKKAGFQGFAHDPKHLGIDPADVGLDSDGMLVNIASFSVRFSPTPQADERLAKPHSKSAFEGGSAGKAKKPAGKVKKPSRVKG